MEGKDTGDWVLIDTGDVIVHVFRPEVREFYQLEKMWMPGGDPRMRRRRLMRLHLCAVGRLRAGPERTLVDDYLPAFDRTGRPLGLGPVTEHEVEDTRGGGMAAEAELLARAMPAGRAVVRAGRTRQDALLARIRRASLPAGATRGGRTRPS